MFGPKSITININLGNPQLMEEIMSTFQELKDMIPTIAKANNSAEVQAEIDAILAKVDANTQALAANAAGDAANAGLIAENRELLQGIITTLADAPASPAPAPAASGDGTNNS